MASSGYYYSPHHYQPAPYYYNHSLQQRASSVPAFLVLATVSLLGATALIALCVSAVDTLVHQLRGFLILSPVLVVIVAQLWVAGDGGGLVNLLAELVVTGDQREQYYSNRYRGGRGAGSSPWGVALALVLVLVLFLVSYQSSIHGRWFWPVHAAVFTFVGVVHGRIRFS